MHRQGKHNALPNHRSSHVIPTLQGGGLAIAVVGIVSLWFLSLGSGLVAQLIFLLPLCLATLTGYWDDFHSLSGRWKLVGIALSTFPLVYVMLKNYAVSVNGIVLVLAVMVVLFGLIWIVNLTNFMDGINGLAVLQALFMLSALLWFRADFAVSPMMTTWLSCVIAACLAFLPFNFPKAKLFLGDTGSLFLGVLMAWILVVMMTSHPNGLWVFLTLFAMFWVDTTITLLQRLRRGKSIFEAHRDHAYQHLANEKWRSHSKATGVIMLVNILWLLPMAHGVLMSTMPMIWFGLAIAPVIIYAVVLKAGKTITP